MAKDAASMLHEALDVWEERERRSSGVVRRGSKIPPPLPKSAVIPPPMPTPVIESRVEDLENDLGIMIDATDRRLNAIEDRQRRIIAGMGELQSRLEQLEAWALRVRDNIEGWRATVDPAHLQDLDDKLHALDSRVSLQFEALHQRVDETSAPASGQGMDHLASQLDLMLSQVSMWKGEHDALKQLVEGS